jgi:hypothetical protein
MQIPEPIKEAYQKAMKAEDEVPENEFTKEFRSKKKKATRLYSIFYKLCEAAGLNHVEVANHLQDNTLYI